MFCFCDISSQDAAYILSRLLYFRNKGSRLAFRYFLLVLLVLVSIHNLCKDKIKIKRISACIWVSFKVSFIGYPRLLTTNYCGLSCCRLSGTLGRLSGFAGDGLNFTHCRLSLRFSRFSRLLFNIHYSC